MREGVVLSPAWPCTGLTQDLGSRTSVPTVSRMATGPRYAMPDVHGLSAAARYVTRVRYPGVTTERSCDLRLTLPWASTRVPSYQTAPRWLPGRRHLCPPIAPHRSAAGSDRHVG